MPARSWALLGYSWALLGTPGRSWARSWALLGAPGRAPGRWGRQSVNNSALWVPTVAWRKNCPIRYDLSNLKRSKGGWALLGAPVRSWGLLRPGAATSEVESAVSALRLRGICSGCLRGVDDLVLRVRESYFFRTSRRIRVVRSKATISSDIAPADTTL